MARIQTLKSVQILNKAFAAKKEKNSSYSQRALARDLGISAAFVTKILTGQKSVPANRFKDLFKILDMDITLQSAFMKATVLEALPSEELRSMATRALLDESKIEDYARESTKKLSLLKQWYNVPILSYLTCETKDSSPAAIAKYFGISTKEATQALSLLEKEGLVKKENDAWIKVSAHSYFPTTKSHEEVRDFHRQMIQKSYRELSKITQEDFEKRLITGFSIAVNPKNVEKAKAMVSEFLAEVSHVLAEGECEEVYQCNVQLFPLKTTQEPS